MAKVTSKLQVTVPKVVADGYGIRPGDEIDWVAAGESIRVVPRRSRPARLTVSDRLRLFDAATARQARRGRRRPSPGGKGRGWSREELYERGRAH